MGSVLHDYCRHCPWHSWRFEDQYCAEGHLWHILRAHGILNAACRWCYLRFFQVRTEGVSGDPSETFEFATFFPDGAQPHVSRVSNILYNLVRRELLVSLRSGLTMQVIGWRSSANGGTTSIDVHHPLRIVLSLRASALFEAQMNLQSGPLPGSDPTDANRRRERGARALEERLAATGSTEADSQMAEP
eukprot:scaffold1929_cov376-Prasinococcus_capsulatus_cf.AAC.20